MKRFFSILFFAICVTAPAQQNEPGRLFWVSLERLDFDAAKRQALTVRDPTMRFEMQQLADILYYEGQRERSTFKIRDTEQPETSTRLTWIRTLNAGYVSLFHDGVKSNAYKKFYSAYQIAQEIADPALIKTSLLAFFKYYQNELIYRSDSFQPHLAEFEKLQEDFEDQVWLTLLKLVFYSKNLQGVEKEYNELAKRLDLYEKELAPGSPLLAYVFFEKAMGFRLANDFDSGIAYFNKAIDQATTVPFLRSQRFNAYLQLCELEIKKKNFNQARRNYERARRETKSNNSLRENADLDLYASYFYAAIGKYDSAYAFLRKGYMEDVELNYQRNAIEVNRLNIELQTQEKENANLRLRQDRNWLISVVAGLALLLVASYFAVTSLRTKNRMQAKEKEVQAMKLEKALKDQEVFGIDAMLEGQEKERQRMAGDLHDNLGSLLATVKLHVHSLMNQQYFLAPDQNSLLKKTDEILNEAYQKVRAMAHVGNVGVNPNEGLLPAVKGFAAKVSVLDRLAIEVEDHGMSSRLDNSLEIMLFRIVQELITNIIKHAQASEAIIHLTHHGDTVNLMIEDNGVGFDAPNLKPTMGMGLYSIQKKVENLGGRVTIESITGKGTSVIIDIPLK